MFPQEEERASRGRALLISLYDAAVRGAAPGPLTTAALHDVPTPANGRVHVLAVGKAAPAMASAAAHWLVGAGMELVGGLIVSPQPTRAPHPKLDTLEGDHPLPSARSLRAATSLGEAVARVDTGDLALVLLSGGASSLVAAAASLGADADVVRLFAVLMGSGLDISAMNAVRKRFTRWGAGRLALALAPARTAVLVMSDVPGDDPADVASGPCAPDRFTARGLIELLGNVGLLERLPVALRTHLDDVSTGREPETLKPGDAALSHVTTRVIGSNRVALDAIAARARSLGLALEVQPSPLAGDAATAGESIARLLCARATRGAHGCVAWGGETTVRLDLPGDARGGRCQELTLAAARVLDARGGGAERITLLAAGTDGRDGPTDAAGAFADASTWRAAISHGRDPVLDLALHRSYDALDAAGALFRPGDTGTNVMDVVIGVVG